MSSSLVASSCRLGEPRESAHYVSSALHFYTHLGHVTSPPLPDRSPRISLKSQSQEFLAMELRGQLVTYKSCVPSGKLGLPP